MNTPNTLQQLIDILQQIAPGSTVMLNDRDNEGCVTVVTNFKLMGDRQTLRILPVTDQSVKTYDY
jgi:hypothetical protein